MLRSCTASRILFYILICTAFLFLEMPISYSQNLMVPRAYAQDLSLAISPSDIIRVRILKSRPEIFISGFGLRVQGDTVNLQSEILPKKRKLHISRVSGVWTATNMSDPKQKEFYKGSELRITGDLLKINDEAAGGEQILKATDTSFDVISELNIEEYLKGVLPSEMPTQWPREALKAQAVAARSYAISIMRERASQPFHVDDTVNHQVFHLDNYIRASLEIREKIRSAIDETKGKYMAYVSGEAYKTFFHSDCGGSTEEPKFVWASTPHNGIVKDERCAINPKSAWSAHIARDELNKILSEYVRSVQRTQRPQNIQSESGSQISQASQISKISQISINSSTISGRIDELLIHFQKESESSNSTISSPTAHSISYPIKGQIFRKLFGFNRVKSTNFIFALTDRGLDLQGRGHGHGAGMCQKGARFMALAGSNYEQILKRYYPNATIGVTVSR